MKKTGTLILTGWDSEGYAYAHSAALALLAYPDATVRGVSKARLPEALEQAEEYGRVLILGVALGGDPARLARTVRALARQRTALCWLSALPPPASVDAGTLQALSPYVRELSLQATVCACLGVKDSLAAAVKANAPLLDAAGYAHRHLEDDAFFAAAVRHIAHDEGPEAWSPEARALVRSHAALSDAPLTGHSTAMIEVRRMIRQLAHHPDVRVLILGESGTGKEAAALMLHHFSERRDNEFVPLNCAASNLHLLEAAFRGHEKGAFTGATEASPGVFERADGGTLFLDEAGDLPLEIQAVLLRILQEGRVMRLGGDGRKGGGTRKVDARVIAATNRDLRRMVREGRFREDLFYRLNTVELRMPALREHAEDIPEIARDLWGRSRREGWRTLSRAQAEALSGYGYPGNVRELANLLERAYALDERDFGSLLDGYRSATGETGALQNTLRPDQSERLADMTRLHVRQVLEKHGGNVSHAAAALGVSRNTVLKYAR
ncbi:MAG TPA: sigma-54 dependent transcriptional regulator [Kiritimatiellia bacterium]|nr:sigma-54 dependent transcriptional regulator [Kiritimatiellia bacterium]